LSDPDDVIPMLDKLADVERRYRDLEERLMDPGLASHRKDFARFSKERAELEPIVSAYREWKKLSEDIEGHRSLLDSADAEVRELAKQELPDMRQQLDALEQRLRVLLLPRDPNDERNVVLEIRAGTGGEEASLFAAELFRMYSRYAERQGWRVEVLSANATGLGGFKEIIALVEGRGAYSKLKYEGGVHRVQRVPVTEASGRIHTSAVTVAVLPEAEDVEVAIDEAKDLRIDVYRSSGPGGQSVNTTDSAVRVTHLPSGLVVSCQDEKSQHKNKAKALKILRARLLERAQAEQQAEQAENRRSMVGSGDRSERVRTYNFPQSRVTDHRINLTLYSLDRVIDGEVDPLIDGLITHYQAEQLQAAS
jgi:peptide chain release factor 1